MRQRRVWLALAKTQTPGYVFNNQLADIAMTLDLEKISDALTIDLPDSYCEFIEELEQYADASEYFDNAISLDTNYIIELNEIISSATNIAGLDFWPEEYFAIGDDGCGNYFTIDIDEEDSPVLFYDHEADEFKQIDDTLNDFAAGILGRGKPQDAKVVIHSGEEANKKKAKQNPRTPEIIHFSENDPHWMKDWVAFMKAFTEIVSRDLNEQDLITTLNEIFGSKPVCWTGKLTKIDLGKYKGATVEMPPSSDVNETHFFSQPTELYLRLRTEEEDYFSGEAISPQILTSLSSWQTVSVGDTIQFQMMFAPGYQDTICCIVIEEDFESIPPRVVINNCGAHLLEIVQ